MDTELKPLNYAVPQSGQRDTHIPELRLVMLSIVFLTGGIVCLSKEWEMAGVAIMGISGLLLLAEYIVNLLDHHARIRDGG